MVSVYRLYIGTEDNSYKKVVTVLKKYIENFTIIKGEGFWDYDGDMYSIDSYVVDFIGYDFHFEKKIKEIEKELGQRRIIVIKNDWSEIN